MFKTYIKVAFRSLWKNKVYSVINIMGLAIGFAGFILILLYINYETSFDKWNPRAADIYRIDEKKSGTSSFSEYTPYPLAAQIKEYSPEVSNTSIIYPIKIDLPFYAGETSYFIQEFYGIDSTFFKLFPYKVKYGSLVYKPGAIILTEGASKRFFGNINPVGKELTVGKDLHIPYQPRYTIAAVLKSPPGPSHLDFDALSWLPPQAHFPGAGWGLSNVITYVSIKTGASAPHLTKKIANIYQQAKSDTGDGGNVHLLLEPVNKIHLQSPVSLGHLLQTMTIIALLAVCMLLIACINFTNLSNARAVFRAKEVGMKKILGVRRYKLILQFIGESFFQCLIAFFLALILAELLLPSFNHILGLNLTIWNGSFIHKLAIEFIVLLVLVTLAAGSYPAFFLSGYLPVKVLKGDYSRGIKGRLFRNTLLALQFFIAAVFMVGLFVINKQIRFMKTRDLGFNPHQVIALKTFNTYTKPYLVQQDREKLLRIPGVTSVAVANEIPGDEISVKNYFGYHGNSTLLQVADVSYDYFKTLDIKTSAGRTFSANFPADTFQSAVINESAAKSMGIAGPVNKIIQGCGATYKIIGVVKDYYQSGFEKAIPPIIYLMHDACSNNWKTNMLVKVNTMDISRTLEGLKKNWGSINVSDPVLRYSFLDQDYGKLFLRYERLSKLFFIATILTILIALAGLLGLAAFIAQQRTKEIGIRRVLGASGTDIIRLLNKDFIRLILLANLVSWPVIYILTEKWLNNFAYRINMPLLLFPIATLMLVVLTFTVIGLLTWRMNQVNPADALKYE